MSEPTRRFTLRDLPFVARLVLAAFLISVGIGYLAALVQLHVQQAAQGQTLPGEAEVIATYHGKPGMSALERLVTANENLPLTGTGSMRSAFTTNSLDWNQQIEELAFQKFAATLPPDLKDEEKQEKWDKLDPQETQKKLSEAREEIRKEREVEADALVAWIHAGADKASYENDSFPRPEALKDAPMQSKFVAKTDKAIKIRTLLRSRCARCHQAGREVPDAPLVDYKDVHRYATVDSTQTGAMPMRKLAQSTHVHLLGFSMLYAMTGLIFALSSWPAIFRFLIAPLALVAQMVDVSFWWLARMNDPYGSEFARAIRISGGVVGVALALQIILGLFSLFGWFGRFVLVILMGAALVGAYFGAVAIAPDQVAELKKQLGL